MDLAGGFPPFPSFYYPVYWHLLSSHVPWNRVVPVCACRVFVFSFRCVVPFFPFPFFLFPFFFARKFTGTKRTNGSTSYFGSQLEFGFCQTVQRGRGGEEEGTRTGRGSLTAFSFCDASVSRFGKF